MATKQRDIFHSGELRWSQRLRNNVNEPWVDSDLSALPLKSKEITVSDSHGWPDNKDGRADVGGNFTTKKIIRFEDYGAIVPVKSVQGNLMQYTGPQWAISPAQVINDCLNAVNPTSDASLMALGTKAIANCLPTNSVADAATFIGELRSGLPKAIGKSLFKSKFKDFREYGSEYLNWEFGWKPILSDLQKFQKAAVDSNKVINQLHRDSGKLVRRRYEFPVETVSTTYGPFGPNYVWTANNSGLTTDLYTGSGSYRVNEVRTTRTWFSGAFTYHVNLGSRLTDKMDRTAAEARKLYGLEITPELAWNLAPWSWLADWEGNIGDVLHNVSAFSQDGLVMPYGYIMQEKTYDMTVHRTGGMIRYVSGQANNGTCMMRIVSQSKVRRAATPFGFGFDMNALTGRQSAILGALGLSRVPRR